MASDVIVDGDPAAMVTVRSSPASEANFDEPNVEFQVSEVWMSSDGDAFPEVTYRVWIDGNTKTGDVFAIFTFFGTTCDYTARILGGAP